MWMYVLEILGMSSPTLHEVLPHPSVLVGVPPPIYVAPVDLGVSERERQRADRGAIAV